MDKIQSIINELMDAALMGEGDHQEAPVCCVDIYNGLVDLESALHSVEAEKEPEWIICAERLPAEEDADFESYVWAYNSRSGTVGKATWHYIESTWPDTVLTHWMPTGLVRPAPPEHKPE